MRYWILMVLLGASSLGYADSSRYSPSAALSGASTHASGSALHGLAASGQVTLAVSAAPLAIGASAGMVGGSVAGASTNAVASHSQPVAPIGTPLPITNEVITIEIITVAPPNVALQSDKIKR